ncbi:MAG TPA: aminotransferase class V-fold PLP-dependent enzyme [Chloroflexia bacterium]|nr:aminotransferase class V-fold PLP-dependent enzyme [Chloroflexia bacterium]
MDRQQAGVLDLNGAPSTVSSAASSADHQAAALAAFLQAYPAYDSTRFIDELRTREYGRLDALDQVYLDYTGGGLYAESQLREHLALLSHQVFGNPHSANPTSLAMTHLVEEARSYVLQYFDADPAEYAVIFTANASGALKLVGESYPFGPGGQYLLTFDNHNSVNGIREFARAKGAAHTYLPVLPPDLRADDATVAAALAAADPAYPNLFAYPAQSNFSGVQHPLSWIAQAQAQGWDVLLDAAAFAPTNRLDLRQWHPDFVTLSFYKIFGYPTGVGCLIARRDALRKLHRPWFAGGTITIASVQGDGYFLEEGEAGFEDGTINYLTLPAVEIGLRHIAAIGIDAIHTRVFSLTGWLLNELTALRHSNGTPLLRVYGPLDTDCRGGTVTVNFCDPEGHIIDYRIIESAGSAQNISLRTGCFCNPGADEAAHGLTKQDLEGCFKNDERMTFEQFIVIMDGRAVGAVRVSLGLASNFADAYRFLQFARTFIA